MKCEVEYCVNNYDKECNMSCIMTLEHCKTRKHHIDYEELKKNARVLAIEADEFQCDEGDVDGMKLADAIGAVLKITGI